MQYTLERLAAIHSARGSMAMARRWTPGLTPTHPKSSTSGASSDPTPRYKIARAFVHQLWGGFSHICPQPTQILEPGGRDEGSSYTPIAWILPGVGEVL